MKLLKAQEPVSIWADQGEESFEVRVDGKTVSTTFTKLRSQAKAEAMKEYERQIKLVKEKKNA